MYARAVQDASQRLHALHVEEREDVAVAAVALALSVGATQVRPALALPLFVGGLVVAARGIRATWRHWDLVDRLTRDGDAYAIPEVFARAARETTLERRRTFAAVLHTSLQRPSPDLEPRLLAAREEIEALIGELEDERLRLEAEAAVACMQLVSDGTGSPLLNAALPPDDLQAHVRHIRSGFREAGLEELPRGDVGETGTTNTA